MFSYPWNQIPCRTNFSGNSQVIEEGWKQKQRQRLLCLFGGKICSIPCCANCFVLVNMIEKVDFNRFFQINWDYLTVSFKLTKTKQLARQGFEQILLPKQMQWPLPLLLFPFFFYASSEFSLLPASANIIFKATALVHCFKFTGKFQQIDCRVAVQTVYGRFFSGAVFPVDGLQNSGRI